MDCCFVGCGRDKWIVGPGWRDPSASAVTEKQKHHNRNLGDAYITSLIPFDIFHEKLTRKLEIESGTSKAGNEWKKQSFLIDTGNQYNPEICFQLFGEDKIDMLNHHDEGSKVEVSFNLSPREYNGRYFHNIDAWRIESIEKSEEKSEDIPEFNSSADDEDDLPF